MKKGTGFKKNKPIFYKAPLLFLIPLDFYSDQLLKPRDKKSFQKNQKLDKKCEQLRENVVLAIEQQSDKLEISRYLVLRAIPVNNSISGGQTEQ
jgi:hypothetical protein